MALKIAVIGSGIAGLSAAWYLGKKHNVTLFEKADNLGLGQKSLEIATPNGHMKMDIPPRVTNRGHYKAFYNLLDEVGAEVYTVKQVASFNLLDGSNYLEHRTWNNPWFSLSLPSLKKNSLRWLLEYQKDLIRFYKILWIDKPKAIWQQQSIAEFLKIKGFKQGFVEGFLYPMWALICTCEYENIGKFPAQDMLDAFRSFTGSTQSLRLRGGTKALETLLVQRVQRFLLGVTVQGVEPKPKGCSVHTENEEHHFDHVIVATEPHIAARLVGENIRNEAELLRQFPVADTEMVVHTDTKLMPNNIASWSSVNLFWDKIQKRYSATLWMNRLEEQPLENQGIFQTWNPCQPISPEKILARRVFKRSLLTPESARARELLSSKMRQDSRHLWYVGAYLTSGIPLLENGVASSVEMYSNLEAALSAAGQNHHEVLRELDTPHPIP